MRRGPYTFLWERIGAPIWAIGPIYEAMVTRSEVITLASGVIFGDRIEREIVLFKLLTNLGGSLTIVSCEETSA